MLAVTDPDAARGSNVSAFIVEKTDQGVTFGAKERKLGIKGSPTRELILDQVRIPGDRMIGNRAPASSSPCAPWTTPASPSAPKQSASPKEPSTSP